MKEKGNLFALYVPYAVLGKFLRGGFFFHQEYSRQL